MLKIHKGSIVGLCSVLIIFVAVNWAFSMWQDNEAELAVKHDLVGAWVWVDGLCESKVDQINIDGIDIMPSFNLVRNGHETKINNMDIKSVDRFERNCGEFGALIFDYEVSINTTIVETFKYGKGEGDTQALATDSGRLYFRFTPNFKAKFDKLRGALAPVAGLSK